MKAMKLMNEIESDRGGVIKETLGPTASRWNTAPPCSSLNKRKKQLAKQLLLAIGLLGMHTLALADDIYFVMAQVKNGQVQFSPCAHLEITWPGSFERAADEQTIREYIKKYPPVSAERPHAGFFAQVIAQISDDIHAAETMPATAAADHVTQEPQARMAIREILSLHQGSCNILDILDSAFPDDNDKADKPKEK